MTANAMSESVQRSRWIQVKRVGLALTLLLICAATVKTVVWGYRVNASQQLDADTTKSNTLATLSEAAVDRLRMTAAGGRDALALASLQQAAQAGSVSAMRAAASVLLLSPQKADLLQGLQWVQLAAQKGDSGAQYLFGKALFDGNATLQVDRQQAKVWFESAAQQKHPQATYFLGLMHQNGYGVGADAVRAAQWFKQAADLGNPDAMFMLANAYVAGAGVPANQARAVELYRAAAEQEHPLAAQALSYALRDGTLGLKRNNQQSQEMMVEVEHALKHPRSTF